VLVVGRDDSRCQPTALSVVEILLRLVLVLLCLQVLR